MFSVGQEVLDALYAKNLQCRRHPTHTILPHDEEIILLSLLHASNFGTHEIKDCDCGSSPNIVHEPFLGIGC